MTRREKAAAVRCWVQTALDLGLRVLSTRRPVALGVALAAHAIFGCYVALVTLQRFPNSGDEYAYLLSAELFAEGRVFVPSPQLRPFFDLTHVINDGRFFGKYPPGWPAVLALAVAAGAPWLANLVLGAGTLALVYVLGRRHLGTFAANTAMYLSVACPFLVFNAASLFAHPLCLFCLTAATLCALEIADRPGARSWYLLLGASLGMAFATRPFTSVVCAAALGVALGRRVLARPRVFARGALAYALPPLALTIGAFLLYNRLTTESWFLQPFQLHDPGDGLGFHRFPRGLGERLYHNGALRVLQLVGWAAVTPLLVVIHFLWGQRRSSKEVTLVAVPIALLLAFLAYWGDGWFQYGPRYLYEAMFALLLLGGLGLRAVGRLAPVALLLIVALNGSKLRQAHAFYADQVRERKTPFDLVSRQGLDNAVVFMRTGAGSMPRRDLARNGIRFDGPVLFVNDRGPANQALVARFPGRRFYTFSYDLATRVGKLEPVETTENETSFLRDVLPYRKAFDREPRFLP